MGCVPAKDSGEKDVPRSAGEKVTSEDFKAFSKYFVYLSTDNVCHLYNTETAEYRAFSHTPMTDDEAIQSAYAKIGSRIYVAGGLLNGKPHSKCLLLKISSDGSLSERNDLSPMRVEKKGNTLVALNLNSIYSIGGFSDKKSLNVCEKYDMVGNMWSSMPSLNEKKGSISCTVHADTYIYAFGGRLDFERYELSTTIEFFNTANGQKWEIVKVKEGGYFGDFGSAACVQFNENILVCGGNTGNCWLYKVSTCEMVDAEFGELPGNCGFQTPMLEHSGTLVVVDMNMKMLIFDKNGRKWSEKAKDEWAKEDVKVEPAKKVEEQNPVAKP